MAAPKILVFGSVNGALQSVFIKAATLHSKNQFDFAIITGNLFSENDDETVTSLLSGDIKVPLPTYFTVGTNSLPARVIAKIEADEEICENLHFLGKRSVTKITEGARIVALGGLLDREIMGGTSKEQYLPYHTVNDAKALKGAGKADILLTATWPAGVWAGSKVAITPENQAALASTQEVAELCDALRPRYHFSMSPADFFYEREPFVHPPKEGSLANDAVSFTRFISMAPYGNPSKAKAMYAFTLQLGDTAVQAPIGSTASPFAARAPKRKPVEDEGYNRFSTGHDQGRHHGGRRGKRRQRSPPPGPDRCFFCLSNPNLPLHMVCTVAEDSYLATAKGPLATPTTFAEHGINFPGHLIITPLAHTPTIANSDGVESYTPEDAQRTHAEMTRFRESLQAMLAAKSHYKLGAVTWEISRARNIHCHWQFHPLPADLIYKGLAEAGFRVEAENLKYPPFQDRELSFQDQLHRQGDGNRDGDGDGGGGGGGDTEEGMGDYFRVWLWADNGEDRIKGSSLVMPLPRHDGPGAPRFDLQFPRRVVAKLLGLENRLVWQDCVQSEEDESKDVAAFREAFHDWDFTTQGQESSG
ncbi:hypothetical protein SODALDRAFT_340572 [Sodiomyces alkalinus F11]|uniref:CwfJ domain-containing protein n=1 Tax=Sodiomyces alkalinus (strain CBS 110278 / VKM F-3762 / F11) TaxID=1314773 RepID=A0A3N2PRS2_SODAK|nr:hypothetical protein SODALDRAFT_340572 [Sodiomyces alkalinus F11]ROT37197.1 hypothetical protein SODALDRAFT_340572 [Sodiomyces alkalinus F11]